MLNSNNHTLIHSFLSKTMFQWLRCCLMFSILIPLIIISFSACEKQKISEDTLVKIYTDIIIAQDTTSGTALKIADINESIFKKYNVSAGDYEEGINKMESNPEQWDRFFNKVIEHVESLRKKEKEK